MGLLQEGLRKCERDQLLELKDKHSNRKGKKQDESLKKMFFRCVHKRLLD